MFQSISFWNWSFKDPDDEMIETETQELNQETKRNQQTQKSSKIEEQGIIVWVNLFFRLFYIAKLAIFAKIHPWQVILERLHEIVFDAEVGFQIESL